MCGVKDGGRGQGDTVYKIQGPGVPIGSISCAKSCYHCIHINLPIFKVIFHGRDRFSFHRDQLGDLDHHLWN